MHPVKRHFQLNNIFFKDLLTMYILWLLKMPFGVRRMAEKCGWTVSELFILPLAQLKFMQRIQLIF